MRQNGIAWIGGVALRVIEHFAILLTLYFPLGARRANTPDGKPASYDLDVLAHPFVRICGDLLNPKPRSRRDRSSLHSKQQAANRCNTRQSSHAGPPRVFVRSLQSYFLNE
jgi:hypothetical protein